MNRRIVALAALLATLVLAAVPGREASAAEGTMTWGVHVSLTPAFFDPADATGTALPLMVYYAVHDALVRPLPGTQVGAALAQSWTASPDGLVYEFEYAYLVSIGPRVLFDGVNAMPNNPYTAPYEDLRLKKR